MTGVVIFGEPDEKAVAQIKNVMRDERAVAGALMADHHLGYSMPIGGVVAYQDAISPSGVGFDIACGNKAVRTELSFSDVEGLVPDLMAEVRQRVSFGLGRTNLDRVEHELFERPVWSAIDPGGKLKEKARAQLGTVGSGNHYVDLLVDEDDQRVWVANHFGSRGLGHTIATRYMKIAYGEDPDSGPLKEREEPAVLDLRSPAGDEYVAAMALAGEYAYAGRDYVIQQVLAILGTRADIEVHNHHNFAWYEDGLWVVRKGATPLELELAFIGGSMGDVSVIVQGKGDVGFEDGHVYGVEDIGALGSAPHGAGRVMSRTQAAGKLRKVSEVRKRPDGTEYTFKVRRRDPSTAAIDWPKVKQELEERGITVLGSGADEAPGVYKDLRTVLGFHPNIEVRHTLHPVGVVMAGEDTFDPFKD